MLTATVKTTDRQQVVDITRMVGETVEKSGVKEGICHLVIPHTTAGLTINEGADPSVREDIIRALDGLVPRHGRYHHLEGNAAAHIKASLLGSSLAVCIQGGQISLGTWQSIYFCEFDGPRRREVWVMFSPA